MAAVAHAPRRSLLGSAAAAVAGRVSRRVRAGAAAARQNVLTAAGLGAIDVGCFHAGQLAGWIALGVSLLVLDFAIRG